MRSPLEFCRREREREREEDRQTDWQRADNQQVTTLRKSNFYTRCPKQATPIPIYRIGYSKLLSYEYTLAIAGFHFRIYVNESQLSNYIISFIANTFKSTIAYIFYVS